MTNSELLLAREIRPVQPLQILLVEDSPTSQKLLVKQIEGLGHAVIAVADGETGVEAARQMHYDIILMDCQLPGMSGFEATIAIRQQEQATRPICPAVIIALTGSPLPEDQEQATAAGMNEYLLKPVRKEALAAVLTRWRAVIQSTTQPEQSQSDQTEHLDRSDSSRDCSDYLSSYLDLKYLHRLSDNNLEFEAELLQIFVQDSSERLQRLQQAIDQQDIRQIEQTAHHLKGASANVGASLMYRAAAQLEQQAYQKQLSSPAALLAQIEISLRQIQAYIEQDK